MIATITLADAQLQIGATVVLLIVVAAVFFVLGRISMAQCPTNAEEQAEIDRIEAQIVESCERATAQMTPFRGPLWPAIDEEPDLYTEHSPQIAVTPKPAGPFEDDWRGGEYGGANSMLMRAVKEKEIED